jgi:hypothetical protein
MYVSQVGPGIKSRLKLLSVDLSVLVQNIALGDFQNDTILTGTSVGQGGPTLALNRRRLKRQL